MEECVCSKCNKIFSTSSNLQRHIKKKKPCAKEINHECIKCGKRFQNKIDLDRHSERKVPCTESINNKKVNSQMVEIYQQRLELQKQRLALETKKIELELHKLENNINIGVNNGNVTIHINKPVSGINFTLDNVFRHIDENLQLSLQDFMEMVGGTESSVRYKLIKILEYTYKNPNFPDWQNIMFNTADEQFYIATDGKWTKTKYKDVRDIVITGLSKIITGKMLDYQQNGVMNGGIGDEFDDFAKMRFRMSDCNTLLQKVNSNNPIKKHETEFQEIMEDSLQWN